MSATALRDPAFRLQPTTVPPGPDGPSRPQLRLLDGCRAPSRLAQQAVYRRRRLVVGVLVVALVVGLTLLASAAVARLAGGAPSAAGGPSPTSADAPGAAGVAALPTVVVQPGDTLWTIAADVAPDADVRITVDELVALNGSSPIVPGQELVLPG
jgi:hypothetical protein